MAIIARFEMPNPQARWDSPLFVAESPSDSASGERPKFDLNLDTVALHIRETLISPHIRRITVLTESSSSTRESFLGEETKVSTDT
mmetsp:Transcript_6867/g.14123  ORF Transcript_6867/g.14123 Transcript_6867/m.14123 type:complete len:86 (+) Transcript_6867:247-504(+)